MIVIFTSLNEGGIFQLANQCALTLKTMGLDLVLYVPYGTKEQCSDNIRNQVREYTLLKTVNPKNKSIEQLSAEISKLKPDLFITVDDAIRSELILLSLNTKIKSVVFVHDVTPHIQNFSIRKYVVETIRNIYRKRLFKRVTRIVLLSQNSVKRFERIFTPYKQKVIVFPLGAHIIPTVPERPAELEEEWEKENFILFFGRIDKYKGIERLIEAHLKNGENIEYRLKLIIAGKAEKGYKIDIPQTDMIKTILRYISDGEMIWLFQHCKTVVLPYYEASQSGVLPIAYKYGKPVVVSNIDGLSDLVDPDKTGQIFGDTKELADILYNYNKLTDNTDMEYAIKKFYSEHYDWTKNMQLLFDKIG